MTGWPEQLITGAAALDVDIDAAAAGRMLDYLALLEKWNRAYNLTGVTGIERQIAWHLLDSLSVAPWLRGTGVVDVGTGAGLPGIPLALANPGRRFTLVDSRAKRVRFLDHVCRSLSLENVEIRHGRAEDFRVTGGFDTVVARALAALPKLVTLTGHLLAPGGIILAMKGRDPQAEAASLDDAWRVRAIHPLQVPGLAADRHLVEIEKS